MSNGVFIGKGRIHGKAVFAGKDFKKGEVVVKYNLKHLTENQFNELSRKQKDFTHKRKGIIYIYSEPERYVNHSEDPNTIQDFQKGCDVAVRDINKGEEITGDSGKDDF